MVKPYPRALRYLGPAIAMAAAAVNVWIGRFSPLGVTSGALIFWAGAYMLQTRKVQKLLGDIAAGDTDRPAGLFCPGCGQPAWHAIGGQTALCGNLDCAVLMWDPLLSLRELMAELRVIDLRGFPGGG